MPTNLIECSADDIWRFVRDLQVATGQTAFDREIMALFESSTAFIRPLPEKFKSQTLQTRKGGSKVVQYPISLLFTPRALCIDSTWEHPNELQSNPAEDEMNPVPPRYRKGPRWSTNSCAYDCAIMLSLYMEVGRVEYDQLPLHSLAKLS